MNLATEARDKQLNSILILHVANSTILSVLASSRLVINRKYCLYTSIAVVPTRTALLIPMLAMSVHKVLGMFVGLAVGCCTTAPNKYRLSYKSVYH